MTNNERHMMAALGIVLEALESVRLELRANRTEEGFERGKLMGRADGKADSATRHYIELGKDMGWRPPC